MSDDEQPLLDPDSIAALRALDSEELPEVSKDVAELFLSTTTEKLTELREAFDRGDWKVAEDAAHSIKGSAGNFGKRVWTIAERIEVDCRARRAESAQIDGLAAELDEMYAAIRKEFGL